MNDGLAFPFVYLALIVAAQGMTPSAWAWEWPLQDILYRIIVGGVMGWAEGRLLGHILFSVPKSAVLAETGSGVIALAGVLLCYGSTELVEGYGFIAVAVLGVTLRRIEEDHHFHKRLHDFSESIEHALTAGPIVALGAILPTQFADLTWIHIITALFTILLIRPLSGWIALWKSDLPRRDRTVISIYGVRGICSVYYLCYAASQIEFVGETQL